MSLALSTSVRAGYEACVDITRARARNFYVAFLTLPAPSRRAICAVYAYCRLLDDIADGPLPRNVKAQKLDEVRRELDLGLAGGSDSPTFIALAHAVETFGIPVEHLLEVAQGVEQDLDVHRYETFEDLRGYCHLVASAVGLACLEVFGYHSDEARPAAAALGIAMQLTNVIRDVAEDAAEGRIYLPREDLHRFGVREEDVLAQRSTPQLTRLLAFEAERAKTYYAQAQTLFQHLPRRSRPCPMVLFGVYRAILDQIERTGYDVFKHRASLSKARRAHIALSFWIRGLVCKPPR